MKRIEIIESGIERELAWANGLNHADARWLLARIRELSDAVEFALDTDDVTEGGCIPAEVYRCLDTALRALEEE